MTAAAPDTQTVWSWLADVADPEIPVISVVDLGIVRDVAWNGDTLDVTITPTYSGCPATAVIARDIETALHAHGIADVRLHTAIAPAWTTDWITDAGKQKLLDYGIAPPTVAQTACPRCGSAETSLISQFASTPCKALYRCESCREPFDRFKCH